MRPSAWRYLDKKSHVLVSLMTVSTAIVGVWMVSAGMIGYSQDPLGDSRDDRRDRLRVSRGESPVMFHHLSSPQAIQAGTTSWINCSSWST